MSILITSDNFEQIVTNATKPVIIDVFAEWCGPCQQMAPIFKQLSEEMPEYTFAKINVDESRDLAVHYGVTSIPTFIFIKDNNVVGKVTGYLPKNDLVAKIKQLFA